MQHKINITVFLEGLRWGHCIWSGVPHTVHRRAGCFQTLWRCFEKRYDKVDIRSASDALKALAGAAQRLKCTSSRLLKIAKLNTSLSTFDTDEATVLKEQSHQRGGLIAPWISYFRNYWDILNVILKLFYEKISKSANPYWYRFRKL
jgi:hypothetical protein